MSKSEQKLLIVESPAKAKTIEKYLDHEYTVRASIGHVRDLPKSNKNAIDIAAGFVPHYEISEGKEKVISELKKLAKNAEEVVLATDPDREGEAIAWHVAEAMGLNRDEGRGTSKQKVKRVTFHEITKEAVQEALKHPRGIDMDLLKAQEARRVLDRLFGYDLSGLIWQKLRYGLSAGRVQSPALRILVEREREIRAFVPEKFWVIDAVFATGKVAPPDLGGATLPITIPAHCQLEPKTAEEAEKIVAEAKQVKWQVKGVEQTEAKRAARAPFTTSTLQQAASSRLGYSPSITMRLAQKLYEAGHITYMRTDSTNLSGQALAEIANVVKDKFGDQYYQARKFATKSKSAQEAHEAIRPSHSSVLTAGQALQEQKLYKLIWARAVASQMSEAKINRTKILIETVAGKGDPSAEGSPLPLFESNGSIVTFDGWLKADPAARGEDVELPVVQQGESLIMKQIDSLGKETEGPKRYSEAGLVKELEKRGIGRPSTYAPTIKTIIDRGYVEKVGALPGRQGRGALKPTETGEVVSEFLEKNFASYISDSFTSEMEDNLDEIAGGKREYIKTLKEFYDPFTKDIASKKKMPKISNLGEAPANIKCPVCGGAMIIKLSRAGKFYSCAKFPECTGALTMEGKEMAGPKETGEACPECKDGKLIEREGRFGSFVACNNYPKCKYIKKDANGNGVGADGKPTGGTGVQCPVCKTGEMVERKGRYGLFYSCSSYPKCKNAIKAKPTGNLCPTCGSLMMEGTKMIPERCSNKTCANHNPHKLEKRILG